VDGLILYDIDDEADRNPEERPFPFLPTMDPADYLDRHLKTWGTPVVVYRATAKYTEQELLDWMASQDTTKRMAVFVGASSREKRVATTLRRAQQLRTEANPDLLLGAVAIPERHTRNGDEHLRLTTKQEAGCSYFVTQVVYDVNAAKNLVSDYAYECHDRGLDPIPIVFTFSVCGSMQTLKFLRWLGVDVPRWIENDLRHAEDTLEASLENRARSDVLLPPPWCPVRHQRRVRFDPQSGDRGERAPGRAAPGHVGALRCSRAQVGLAHAKRFRAGLQPRGMNPTPAILLDLVDGSPVRVWALAREGFIWNESRNGASWEETAERLNGLLDAVR
jgi:hypothetical protein